MNPKIQIIQVSVLSYSNYFTHS